MNLVIALVLVATVKSAGSDLSGAIVQPTSILDCQACCRLAEDGSFAVGRCMTEGCNQSESEQSGSSPIARTFLRACDRSKACEIGRDFRLLGSSKLVFATPQRCVNGQLSDVELQQSTAVAVPENRCVQCCAALNLDYDFTSDEPPGFANDFTRARCADGCRRASRCANGAFYDQNRHRDRLGCALGLDFLQVGGTQLRDLQIQCDANSGKVSVQSRSGRTPVTQKDCKTCCSSLPELPGFPDVSFNVVECQEKGCSDLESDEKCLSNATGCEVGRDLLYRGSVRVTSELEGFCVGGVVQGRSTRPRTREVLPSSLNDCRSCCASIDERFDDSSSVAQRDDFSRESCQRGCERSQTCVDFLETASLESSFLGSTHRSRLGCTMGTELRNDGVTVLRDMAFQCNSDGTVKAVAYDGYESNVLGLEELTNAPSRTPTLDPTGEPTGATEVPTLGPSTAPTRAPSTLAPTSPTFVPTQETPVPTTSPNALPTGIPNVLPTSLPSARPSSKSLVPTESPSVLQTTTGPTRNPIPGFDSDQNVTSSPTGSPVVDTVSKGSGFGGTECNSLSPSFACISEDLVFIVYFSVFGGILLLGLLCVVAVLAQAVDASGKAPIPSLIAVLLAMFSLASEVLVALELLESSNDELALLGTIALASVATVLMTNLVFAACLSFYLVTDVGLQPWFKENGVLHGVAMLFGIITVESYAVLGFGVCGLNLPLPDRTIYSLRIYGAANHLFGDIPQVIVTLLAYRLTGWTAILLIGLVTSGCSLLYGLLFRTAAVCHSKRAKAAHNSGKASELEENKISRAESSSAVQLETT